MAGLVHDLGGGVVLGVDPRHGLDDLGRAEQRALLAVHELREQPVLVLDPELQEALLVPLLQHRAGDESAVPLHLRRVGLGVGDDHLLLVDLDRPVQVGLPVPLGLLGLLVELVELGLGALLVVPGELGRAVVGHVVEALDVVVADEAQHGLEVVDVVTPDQLQVGPHLLVLSSSSVVIALPPWWWSGGRMWWIDGRRWSGGCGAGASEVAPGRVQAQGEDAGQDEGAHQRAGVVGVGQVGVGRRVGAVGHHDAHGPLGRPGGLSGSSQRAKNGAARSLATQQHPVDAAEGQVGQDGAGLVLQQIGQGLVVAQPAGRLDHAGHEHVLEVGGLAHDDGQRGERGGPPRSRPRRRGCPPCPEGRSGRRWPGTGRPPGRCRRPWSWRCPAGPGSAAHRRRGGPGSTSGRPLRGAGRRPVPCPRRAAGARRFSRAAIAPTDETVWRFLSHCQPLGTAPVHRCSRLPAAGPRRPAGAAAQLRSNGPGRWR